MVPTVLQETRLHRTNKSDFDQFVNTHTNKNTNYQGHRYIAFGPPCFSGHRNDVSKTNKGPNDATGGYGTENTFKAIRHKTTKSIKILRMKMTANQEQCSEDRDHYFKTGDAVVDTGEKSDSDGIDDAKYQHHQSANRKTEPT